MKGSDVFVSFPTGYGKSMVYAIHGLWKAVSCALSEQHWQLPALSTQTTARLNTTCLHLCCHVTIWRCNKKTGLINDRIYFAAQVGQNPIRLTRPFPTGNGCGYARLILVQILNWGEPPRPDTHPGKMYNTLRQWQQKRLFCYSVGLIKWASKNTHTSSKNFLAQYYFSCIAVKLTI